MTNQKFHLIWKHIRRNMDCPDCQHPLHGNGPWGYLARHQSGEVLGDTFICPNAEGFDSEEQALQFLEDTNRTMEDLGVTEWVEITCDSAMHSVSGSYYTDKQGNIHPGYPC